MSIKPTVLILSFEEPYSPQIPGEDKPFVVTSLGALRNDVLLSIVEGDWEVPDLLEPGVDPLEVSQAGVEKMADFAMVVLSNMQYDQNVLGYKPSCPNCEAQGRRVEEVEKVLRELVQAGKELSLGLTESERLDAALVSADAVIGEK